VSDNDKPTPLFADGWYKEPRVQELRQEIQTIYRRLGEIEGEIEREIEGLESTKVDRAGDTMTGPLHIESDSTVGLQIERLGAGTLVQLVGGAGNAAFLRAASGPENTDVLSSLILRGDAGDVRFRPGDTSATSYEMWHDGNATVTTDSNGTAVRFPNGIQVCWHSVTLTRFGSTSDRMTLVGGWQFPQAFHSSGFPTAFVTLPMHTSGAFSNISGANGGRSSIRSWGPSTNTSTTTMSISVFLDSGTVGATSEISNVQIFAIGRWKA
jgi:hypothetical protein